MALARHQYRIYIKAPIEQVWAQLVEPRFANDYLTGVVEEIEPPMRLVMKWQVAWDHPAAQEPPSRVEWSLRVAAEGVTQVDLVHGDLARSPQTWALARSGWVWVLDGIKSLLETGIALPAIDADADAGADGVDVGAQVSGDWHRAQAIECNNAAWELFDKADRSVHDDEDLLRRVYASAYHWQRASGRGPVNEVRSLYMQAKAHLGVGNAQAGLQYAQRCMAETTGLGLQDFDLAYAHEMMARSLQAVGRSEEAATEWAAAKAVPIADPEDKAIVAADLAAGP